MLLVGAYYDEGGGEGVGPGVLAWLRGGWSSCLVTRGLEFLPGYGWTGLLPGDWISSLERERAAGRGLNMELA